MALDFAVTSGMRSISASIQDAGSPISAYEDLKKAYLDTERTCVSEGMDFTPMVAAAVGGAWGVAASKIYSQLAKEKSLVTGEREEILLLQLYQSLGIILHRENARSVVKRLRTISGDSQSLLGAAVSLQAEAVEGFAFQ